MKQAFASSATPQPVGAYSPAVQIGSTIYCSGQIALDPATGTLIGETAAAQTEQILSAIQSLLGEAGCTLEHVVRSDIFLTDIADFASVNEVYGRWFTKAPLPARVTVAVAALPKGARVEIACTAVNA